MYWVQLLHLHQTPTGWRQYRWFDCGCPGNEAARASLLPGGHVVADVRGAAPGKTRLAARSVCGDEQAGGRADWKNFPPETAAGPAPPPLQTRPWNMHPGEKRSALL